MRLGLKVDVDTLRGTREGVPRLLELFDRHGLAFAARHNRIDRHLFRGDRPLADHFHTDHVRRR